MAARAIAPAGEQLLTCGCAAGESTSIDVLSDRRKVMTCQMAWSDRFRRTGIISVPDTPSEMTLKSVSSLPPCRKRPVVRSRPMPPFALSPWQRPQYLRNIRRPIMTSADSVNGFSVPWAAKAVAEPASGRLVASIAPRPNTNAGERRS